MYAVCNTYIRSVYRVTHLHSYYIHMEYRLCLYLYVNFMYAHKVGMYNKKTIYCAISRRSFKNRNNDI